MAIPGKNQLGSGEGEEFNAGFVNSEDTANGNGARLSPAGDLSEIMETMRLRYSNQGARELVLIYHP